MNTSGRMKARFNALDHCSKSFPMTEHSEQASRLPELAGRPPLPARPLLCREPVRVSAADFAESGHKLWQTWVSCPAR